MNLKQALLDAIDVDATGVSFHEHSKAEWLELYPGTPGWVLPTVNDNWDHWFRIQICWDVLAEQDDPEWEVQRAAVGILCYLCSDGSDIERLEQCADLLEQLV